MNRKKLILSALLLLHGALVYAGTILSFNTYVEDWISLGVSYAGIFQSPLNSEEPINSPFGALGANIDFYSFSNWHNIGYFFHLSLLMPNTIVRENLTPAAKPPPYPYQEEIKTQLGLLTGVAYKKRLDYNVYLHFAGGINIEWLNGIYSELPKSSAPVPTDLNGINVGLGGIFGCKKLLNEAFFVDFGVVFICNFSSTTLVERPDGGRPKYTFWIVKPYVSIGINIVIDKTWYLRVGEDESYY